MNIYLGPLNDTETGFAWGETVPVTLDAASHANRRMLATGETPAEVLKVIEKFGESALKGLDI